MRPRTTEEILQAAHVMAKMHDALAEATAGDTEKSKMVYSMLLALHSAQNALKWASGGVPSEHFSAMLDQALKAEEDGGIVEQDAATWLEGSLSRAMEARIDAALKEANFATDAADSEAKKVQTPMTWRRGEQ